MDNFGPERRDFIACLTGTVAEMLGSTLGQAGRYNLRMRITKGKVVDGQIER